MKKVAVVSCYFQKNYGSALQAYATQKMLDKLGVENVTIRYDGLEKAIKKEKYKFYAKKVLNPEIFFGKIGYVFMRLKKKNPCSKLGRNFKLRDAKIKEFEKNFKLSKEINSIDELSEFAREFDAVLVGSDQLWLTSNLDANYYTLNWVPDEVKRISYATSFGVSKLPENYYEMAKRFLMRIDSLSVREETGKQIIKDVCGRDATVICDPTMMFTAEEWMSIQQKEPIYNEKYIFCYFLGDNPEQREFAKRLSKKTNCKIVSILHLNVYVKSDEKYADYTPYNIDSADFINLIRNAEYVCTDSFHATVFSILNKRSFFTFRRFKESYSLQTNSRLDSLLDYLKLKNRLISADESIEKAIADEINYEDVDTKIKDLRKINLDFLKQALEIE